MSDRVSTALMAGYAVAPRGQRGEHSGHAGADGCLGKDPRRRRDCPLRGEGRCVIKIDVGDAGAAAIAPSLAAGLVIASNRRRYDFSTKSALNTLEAANARQRS